MKVKTFYEPVFEATVIFMTDCLPTEADKWVKRNRNCNLETGYDRLAGSVTFIDNEDNKGGKTREYLVIVESKKAFYVLLHETNHLTTHILEDRQIPINKENDEVRAYVQNYWFRTLWRFMNNKQVVLKRK